MTNAIYVLVDGAPFRPAAADLCYFIGWIDRVEREAGLDLGSDRAVSEAAYQEARKVLYDRLRATGAEGCRWVVSGPKEVPGWRVRATARTVLISLLVLQKQL